MQPKFHKAPIGREKVISFLNQRATSFAADGVSHLVLLEGEVGVGKSHVLRHLSYLYRPTPDNPNQRESRALQFVWGVGDPFLTSKPHSVWRQVFDNILPLMNPATRAAMLSSRGARTDTKDDHSHSTDDDHGGAPSKPLDRGSGGSERIAGFVGRAERQGSHAVNNQNPAHIDSQSTRRDWILAFAKSKNFPPQSRVFAFFNDMLGTNFDETAEEKTRRSYTVAAGGSKAAGHGAIAASEAVRAGAGELLVLLLQEYASTQKVIVALDECQSMSEPDWNATFEVCKAIKQARIK